MKKSITTALFLLTILLSSCNNAGTPAETSGTTATTTAIAAVTTAEVTADTATGADAEETTAAETEPEFDINTEENLPFRLATMTHAEIAAEFGPLECPYMMYGGSPVYISEKLPDMSIVYISVSGGKTQENGWNAANDTDIATYISYYGENTLYPGFTKGMKPDEVYDLMYEITGEEPDWSMIACNPVMESHYFVSCKIGENYSTSLLFSLPDEVKREYSDRITSEDGSLVAEEELNKAKEDLLKKLFNEKIGELIRMEIRYAEAETEPEFAINAEETLPFRLLHMTFEEIEAEFGTLNFKNQFSGGDRVYTVENFSDISIVFSSEGSIGVQTPHAVKVEDQSIVIYPGIHKGMTGNDVVEVLPQIDPEDGVVSYSEMGFYSSYCDVEEYTVQITWDFPESTANELMINTEGGVKAKEYWKDREFNGCVSDIIIHRK